MSENREKLELIQAKFNETINEINAYPVRTQITHRRKDLGKEIKTPPK